MLIVSRSRRKQRDGAVAEHSAVAVQCSATQRGVTQCQPTPLSSHPPPPLSLSPPSLSFSVSLSVSLRSRRSALDNNPETDRRRTTTQATRQRRPCATRGTAEGAVRGGEGRVRAGGEVERRDALSRRRSPHCSRCARSSSWSPPSHSLAVPSINQPGTHRDATLTATVGASSSPSATATPTARDAMKRGSVAALPLPPPRAAALRRSDGIAAEYSAVQRSAMHRSSRPRSAPDCLQLG